MNTDLIIAKSIDINAPPPKVWDVLIRPEKIKEYFVGAETITNWEMRSDIVFIHQHENQEFKNKGAILNFDPNHLLSYTYWTFFSNTEDKPENYTRITYPLRAVNHKTELTLTQTNFKNIAWYLALETGWDTVLAKMKEIAER